MMGEGALGVPGRPLGWESQAPSDSESAPADWPVLGVLPMASALSGGGVQRCPPSESLEACGAGGGVGGACFLLSLLRVHTVMVPPCSQLWRAAILAHLRGICRRPLLAWDSFFTSLEVLSESLEQTRFLGIRRRGPRSCGTGSAKLKGKERNPP